MKALQDIINVITRERFERFYSPQVTIPIRETKIPEDRLISYEEFEALKGKDRDERVMGIMKGLFEKYPISLRQAEALYSLLTTPPEKVKVGYKVKRKLFGKKKKPIYKEVYPAPSAIEKYLSEILKPSPELASPELITRAKELQERISRMKIPTEIRETELPLWLRTYRGETLFETAQRRLRTAKEERERAVRAIQDFINKLASDEVATVVSTYANIPFFAEIGELISKLSGGFYKMDDYFATLRDLASKSKSFVNALNQTLNEILGTQESIIAEIGGVA